MISRKNVHMTSISIIGSGIVGTTTGVGFHKHGNDVLFYDISKKRISELAKEGYKTGTSIGDVISKTSISFVCIDTPTCNGRQDITPLMRAVLKISDALESTKRHHLVVFRSTMLPGTMKKIAEYLDE